MSAAIRGSAASPATITARWPDPGATATSTKTVPGQRRPVTAAASTRGCAIGQSLIGMTSCERCLRRPATPSWPTANFTLVRQPSPSWSPGTGSTVTSRSMPAMRRSCWRTTAAFRSRWAGRLACCQSQPPQPPG